jgi:transposase-like protein
MTHAKLTPAQRRSLVLAALSGVPAMQLAKEYGVARSWVYALIEEAKTDPAGKVTEAYEETDFRRRVQELLVR